MLVDVVLLLAPAAVAFPAVLGLLTSHADLVSRRRLEKRLYATLLMAEKLPTGTVGAAGINRDIDRQTLRVAYAAQYPQRARELLYVALIGGLVAAGVLLYYLVWWESLLTELLVLAGVLAAALWFERALRNFGRNDRVARDLFEHFDAPADLVRPRTELAAKVTALELDEVFARAADARDGSPVPLTTLEAVNVVLAKAHKHVDWRVEGLRAWHHVRGLDYRGYAVVGYAWLQRYVLHPLARWRRTLLDESTRYRAARTHRNFLMPPSPSRTWITVTRNRGERDGNPRSAALAPSQKKPSALLE